MDPAFLRIRRAALGLRQRDVADRASISQSRFSLLERGEVIPTEKERKALMVALQLPVDVAQDLAAVSLSAAPL